MSKENFKDFARLHPELISFVNNNQTTWQKLYELYDIYGEKSNIWDEYFPKNINLNDNKEIVANKSIKDATVSDFINTIKNVDLDTVQKGITNIQKTIGLIQDMGLGGAVKDVKAPYEPRPMYKYFED